MKVSIGVIHSDELAASFHQSYTAMLMYDLTRAGVIAHDAGTISVRCGTDGLVAGRNTVVERFLDSAAEWLLWIDSDMGFDADALYRLLSVADPIERPIVGGLCFASRQYALDGLSGFRTAPAPTIFEEIEVDGHRRFNGGRLYPVNSLVRCAATGSAFVLIHRTVFERLGSGWYERMPNPDGTKMGEDISFCARAAEAGFPIHVHTGVRTNHLKPQWVSEQDYWTAVVPPPAIERAAIIVPVTGRPQNALPFMNSLRASTGLATAYAVCDEGDTASISAWTAAGAHILVDAWPDGIGSFAQKVNFASRLTDEPWILLVGDDVAFRPGWLDHAQHIAHSWNADVIGTNDLGNPRVQAGEHATHLLIRRRYINEVGSSWDGPGVVCHEGYRHWFVDDEIVRAASQRGVWQMALGSIVEHLHPFYGKAADDSVYQLGQRHSSADRKRFEERLKQNSGQAVTDASAGV